jgi:hypothetical protein
MSRARTTTSFYLAIGKDANAEAVEEGGDEGADLVEHLLLGGAGAEASVEVKAKPLMMTTRKKDRRTNAI